MEKALFGPKIAKKLHKFAEIAQNLPKNFPKKWPKQSVKNFFGQSVKNLLRTFFETVRSKIHPSKKIILSVRQKIRPS
jgi:lauroyl/myristoyl acyltransferase